MRSRRRPTDLSEAQLRAIHAGTYLPETLVEPVAGGRRPPDLSPDEVRSINEGNASYELLRKLFGEQSAE